MSTDEASLVIERVVHVTDRTWVAMMMGVELERWPGERVPCVGDRVTVFDRDLEFTQHDVLYVEGTRVGIGPAIPWTEEQEAHEL